MRILAAVCGLLVLTSSYAETVTLPDTPAATRLQQLTELMAEATPERVVSYVDRHYTPEYAQRLPLANRIGSFMNWHRRGGMNVVEVRDSQDTRIEVITHQPLTDERWLLGVEVEAEPPHRVQALMLGRAPLPPMEESLTDAEVAERWLSYVDELAGAGLFSGAVLIARNGEVMGQQAWGLANRDFAVPNSTETRFNLGSMNKTWTAVAIGQLVEEGKVSFDDPLSKFVDYPNADDASRIRIKHLLTHTSGLGNYFTDEFERTARNHLRTIDDYLALSADQPLAFEPGTGGAYSNTGMMVLGRVIEVASGQNYFDYIQQKVLNAAGMSRSGCFELDRVNDNLAVGYAEQWSAEGVELKNNLFEHVIRGGPAGGCYATVGDLHRFARALNDGTLVSQDMAHALTTPKPELDSPNYGYGFGIHPNRSLYGHSGGFVGISANLDITVDPAGWVVVVLANDENMRAPVLTARRLIGIEEPE